jgi:hypothetical protein
MVHPLIQLAATRPQLLLDHAAAWAELLAAECGPALHARRRRLLWQGLGAALLMVGLVLAGVAVMLGALSGLSAPGGAGPTPGLWAALVLTPAVPLLAAAACARKARRCGDGGAAQRLLQQAQADWALLQPQPRHVRP